MEFMSFFSSDFVTFFCIYRVIYLTEAEAEAGMTKQVTIFI